MSLLKWGPVHTQEGKETLITSKHIQSSISRDLYVILSGEKPITNRKPPEFEALWLRAGY